jgi:hypothetical protein
VSPNPFRLIHGGRSDDPTPGLLIVGAAEVVTYTPALTSLRRLTAFWTLVPPPD